MDLTRDSVNKLFYRFLLPAVGSAVAVAIYGLVDTVAVGRGIGPDGAAASAVVLPVFSVAEFIGYLCGVGGSVLMNRARGEKQREKGSAFFTAATVLALALILAVWVPGVLFQDGFYRLSGADDALLPYAREYGSLIFAFLPSFAANIFLEIFVGADGSPRFVLCTTLVGGVLNIFGDWLFVFPLQMGMRGAAIATVIGSLVQVAMLTGYILRGGTGLRLVKPTGWFTAFRDIAVTGFGAGINILAVIVVSFIANNQIMAYAGSTALAVYGIMGTVGALVSCIFSGIGQSAQPIASASYGAGLRERSRSAGRLGTVNALGIGGLFTLCFTLFPVEIIRFCMATTPAVEQAAPAIVRVFALSFIPQALCVFAIYYMQSVAVPRTATVISLLRGLCLSSLFLVLFPLLFGERGIWWAFVGAEGFAMLIGGICLSVLSHRRDKAEKNKNNLPEKA